jgi:hypothetical protein
MVKSQEENALHEFSADQIAPLFEVEELEERLENSWSAGVGGSGGYVTYTW